MRSHTTHFALLALVVALLAASCGGGDQNAGAASSETTTSAATADATTTTEALPDITMPAVPPSDYAGFAAQPTACGAQAPAPVKEMTFEAPEDQNLDPDTPVTATITTSCGDIVIQLDPSIAPETVNSFVFLARSGYYNGSVSHRIVPGFVFQAGDPTATGRGGPGYTIPDELPESGFVYKAGSVAMANSGPDTNGSQFFITLADVPLPADYTYFGQVVDGLDTLNAITQIPLGVNQFGEQSVPLETLYIDSITIGG
jgi:peptidyl-prolyl cis-trans isomerase B (cyclophilin B)